jgi:catechol 2,3-dioxygenase-like lactoylglutathione lyase family enzyme
VAGRHVFYRCGATILLVFRAAETRIASTNPAIPVPVHGATGQGHVCFGVDGPDLDRVRAALDVAGIPVEADFHWPTGARSIYVRDPAGNSVEFAEPRMWDPAP